MTTHMESSLPLVIIFLALLKGYASFTTPPQGPGTDPTSSSRPRGSLGREQRFTTEDYYNSVDDTFPTDSVSPQNRKVELCDYDICLEMQFTCVQLSSSTGCLCPGISLGVPEAPVLKRVSREGSEVMIWWCAPYSHVTSYTVTVAGEERGKFGEGQRRGSVGVVDHGAEVCVVAANEAGVSKGSCRVYQSRHNESLKAGLIGGALGFLLLFSLAVLLWRHRMRRKSESRISTQEVAYTHGTDSENRAELGVQ
ncbi:leucine-rich repeat neuronal protein 4 [Lampris incognitus]|uniref:leucine-rich repeat neuronal protein 4 n=1 Tax=Lampris incognitus TaxID=2546036 RepID=UPI0024B5B913|nr:leucine-rich repeat neuronal protein 4 [Lampris incognitus]